MSQITPGTGPPFVGKASGVTPNLFWRRITFDQLRAQQHYHGLPPLKHLRLESTADYRCLLPPAENLSNSLQCGVRNINQSKARDQLTPDCIVALALQRLHTVLTMWILHCRQVRQESQLWAQLHQGLLTTGKLNAALGFYEPAAAKRLNIPRDRVSHNAILSAISNLQLPAYGLQLLDKPAAPVISVQATTAVTQPPQGLQNAITVSEYEAEAIKLANAAAAASSSSSYGNKSLHKRRRSNKHKHQQQQQQQTRGAATASAAANNSASKAAVVQADLEESTVDPYASTDARRKRCQLVAGRGKTLSTFPFA